MKSTIIISSPNILTIIVWIVLITLPTSESWAFLNLFKKSNDIQGGYLLSESPPKLRFHEVQPPANRKNLHRLVPKVSQEVIQPESPVVSEPAFPIVSFEEPESNSTYQIPLVNGAGFDRDDNNLPPSDPFTDSSIISPNLNNTDELIKILESQPSRGSRRDYMDTEFIPPYTMESGNMLIQSKTKYERRVR